MSVVSSLVFLVKYVVFSFNHDVFVRNWVMFLIGHIDVSYGTFIGKGIYFVSIFDEWDRLRGDV